MSERVTIDERRLTTILSVDVCGYTALSERDGVGARAAVRALTDLVDEVAAAHQGRVFHRAGDGFLAEFPSATCGVQAAVALHESLARAPIIAGDVPIRLRAGLHTGEVAVEPSGDLLGHAVNVASRLQGEAEPGGTLVSAATRALSEAGISTRRIGDLKLKNLREPITTYELLRSPGLLARLRGLVPSGWVRRNRAVMTALGSLALVAAVWVAADGIRRERAFRAEVAAQRRAAAVERQAARLAEELTVDEGRLIDREAVETAAAGLLSSDDRRKAPAVSLVLDGDALGAARALRRVYDAQRAAGASEADLVRTALEVGALASDQDKMLAQWAYEEAYAYLPTEPYVLRRLADIALDRGERDMAKAYLNALLATEPPPAYRIGALNQLGHVANAEGRLEEAERRHRRALALARAHDLARDQAWSLRNLAGAEMRQVIATQGEAPLTRAAFAGASDYLRQALTLARAIEDLGLVAAILNEQASIATFIGAFDEAQRVQEERFALIQQIGDQGGIASVGFNLAYTAAQRGDIAARDAYIATARRAAEEGGVDGMLGYIAVPEAGWMAADGDAEGACAKLEAERRWVDPSDPSLQEIYATLPDLPCTADAAALPPPAAAREGERGG